jgi:hypothetical protein
MSNLHAIGLIGALLLAASFLLFHMAMVLRNVNAGLLAGVVGGVPVSYEFRWRTLWQVQLPVNMTAGVVALLVAFAFLRITDTVEDAAIATLAQACGLLFFAESALWLVSAPVSYAAVMRMLRKAKAD